jgi:hypothetical protein
MKANQFVSSYSIPFHRLVMLLVPSAVWVAPCPLELQIPGMSPLDACQVACSATVVRLSRPDRDCVPLLPRIDDTCQDMHLQNKPKKYSPWNLDNYGVMKHGQLRYVDRVKINGSSKFEHPARISSMQY